MHFWWKCRAYMETNTIQTCKMRRSPLCRNAQMNPTLPICAHLRISATGGFAHFWLINYYLEDLSQLYLWRDDVVLLSDSIFYLLWQCITHFINLPHFRHWHNCTESRNVLSWPYPKPSTITFDALKFSGILSSALAGVQSESQRLYECNKG